MEFVVKHDDGLNGEGLEDADLVLIGVSRTGKTPLSMYLGFQGYKTANVPLVRGIEPPGKLFQIDRSHIVGLTIEPERLVQIRGRRMGSLAGAHSRDGYAELNRIHEELDEANAIQRRLGCPVLDVSNLAVEEAAVRVIELVEARAT
jgi:regulator of PEP synthase PpsR (kinase-PPPase family)